MFPLCVAWFIDAPRRDQQLCTLPVALAASMVERSAAVAVHLIDGCVHLEEAADPVSVPLLAEREQQVAGRRRGEGHVPRGARRR